MFGAIFYFILKFAWYLIYHTYYHSSVDIDVKFQVNWSKSDEYTVLWRWVGSCTENCKFINTQHFVVYATPCCLCVCFVYHSVVWLPVSSMICISGFSIIVTGQWSLCHMWQSLLSSRTMPDSITQGLSSHLCRNLTLMCWTGLHVRRT